MQNQISDLLEGKPLEPIQVRPDSSVREAVNLMNEHNIGALMVMDEGGRLAGVFTERDVLVRVVAAERDPGTTAVREVMTRDPVCISPQTLVEGAMLLVHENSIRHLPVIQQGKLVGVISSGDLNRWNLRSQERRINAMLRAMRIAP
jgi:CBS domain-containing protein